MTSNLREAALRVPKKRIKKAGSICCPKSTTIDKLLKKTTYMFGKYVAMSGVLNMYAKKKKKTISEA